MPSSTIAQATNPMNSKKDVMAAALAILLHVVTASRHTLRVISDVEARKQRVSSACGDTTSARTADLEPSIQSAGVESR